MVIIFGEQGPWEADDGKHNICLLRLQIVKGDDAFAVVFNLLKSKRIQRIEKE